jgi:hypothetical protein
MVVFAGIDHGNGCSGIAASVAKTLAGNARGAVCLVEANFRSPSLPALFGLTSHHGLADALLQEKPIRLFVKPVCDDRLWLLSSGPLTADSPHLLTSDRVKERFAELRAEFDFISDIVGLNVIAVAGQAFQAFERLEWTAVTNCLVSATRLVGAIILVLIQRHPSALQWGYMYFDSTVVVAATAYWLVLTKLGRPSFPLCGPRL